MAGVTSRASWSMSPSKPSARYSPWSTFSNHLCSMAARLGSDEMFFRQHLAQILPGRSSRLGGRPGPQEESALTLFDKLGELY